MIDIQCEQVITLRDAADNCPGKPRTVQTIYRWTKAGVKGVVLECIPVGGLCCTSWEALQRFFERIDAAKRGKESPTRSSVQRSRAAKRAEEELEAMGC